MVERPLNVAILGGIPPTLGGGGLEVQMDATGDALRRRGHRVVHVAQDDDSGPFDVLHAFGSDVSIFHVLHHWRRNRCPLVVSPVLVASPGKEEYAVRLLAKIPWRGTEAQMRLQVLRRADVLVCLTAHERHLLDRLAPTVRKEIVGNGVDPVPLVPEVLSDHELPDNFVLMVGTISRRKQQIPALCQLAVGGIRAVVIGGLDASVARNEVEQALAACRGTWLDESSDRSVVRTMIRRSNALVHLSDAEGQSLAVLEALSEGTPVVARSLPSNVELAEAYPGHIWFCDRIEELNDVVASLPPTRPLPARIPSWDDVAAHVEAIYSRLV